jgi:hypothetical protein
MFTPDFNAFRFYDDSAGEATSVSLTAAQDTDATVNADSNIAFQLRCRIDETGGADGSSMDDFQLQSSKNGGAFINLGTADIGDGIHAVTAGLTNNGTTTNRSSESISDPGGGSFDTGEQSTDGLIDDMLLTASNFTEVVFGIEIVSANVADTDFFRFQFSNSSVNSNNVTPQVTVEKSAAGEEPSSSYIPTEQKSVKSRYM